MSNTPLRHNNIDFLRICSIIAVIVIHSFGNLVVSTPVGSNRWMLANLIDSFMRWSVPVFVMISGTLLIKNSTFIDRKKFIKNKLTRIVIPILIWPLIYVAWYYLFLNMQPSLRSIVNGYLSGSPAPGHLYFLFLIAGLYVIAPIISLYATHTSKRQFLISSLIVLVMTTGWSIISTLLPTFQLGIGYDSAGLNAVTMWMPYVGFFMLGHSIKDLRPKRTWIPVVIFLICGIGISLLTYYMSAHYGIGKGQVFYTYTLPPAIIMSVAAYFTGNIIYEKVISYFTRSTAAKINKILKTLSSATFGVYLIHIILISTIAKVFSLSFTSFKQVFVIFLLTTISSYALSILMLRIPYIRNIVR